MQKLHRHTHFFLILLLLSVVVLACRPTPDTSGAVTTSSPPPASQTPTPQQPTPRPPTATPAATATAQPRPTSSHTPTAEPTLTRRAFQGPAVSYNGIRFTVASALGDQVFVGAEPDSPYYVEFSFAPEGYCWEVGCVTVYPVESYRKEILFGADIIDRLESAIKTQSNSYFPVLMAHILLRAQTQHLRFQNGAGIRAVVMMGQDVVLANNESVMYEFHGLTADGQYYVVATFPVDAPLLLSTYDPAENMNKDAIPVPELPAVPGDAQQSAVMREYNQEVQRQLDLLDGSHFTPDLGLLDALVGSLLIAPPKELPSTDNVGVLHMDIDYRGNWYRRTFSYTRQAENIRHFALVMPHSQVDRATADQVFSSLDFSTGPGLLSAGVRAGREEFAWTLDYLYEAPGGYFRGEFEPGTYDVAAAFVAAPLSRKEAGQPDDAILYAGMTGGGASTDYQKIEIKPGENTITLSLTDRDGWACPWLYVYNGRSFEKRIEILRNVRGQQNERTEVTPIGPVEIVDGSITLRVAEEKDELTFIDELYLIVEGLEVHAEANPDVAARVAAKDQDYVLLTGGASHEFRFSLPDSFAARQRVAVSIVVSGFYAPLEEPTHPYRERRR